MKMVVPDRGGYREALLVQRAPALAGVLAPLIFWSTLILAGLLRPGYNPIRQYGSELGIGPNAWLMNGAFIVFGVLEVAFAFGLDRGMQPVGQSSKWGPILIGTAGVAMVLVGIFPMATGGKRTVSGSIHAHAAQLLFMSMIAAYLVFAKRMTQDHRWQPYARFSVLAGAASFVLFVVYMWGGQVVTLSSWIGLEQRLLLAVTLGWLEILAVRLWIVPSRLERTSNALNEGSNV